jgi:hypothetical protein
MTRMPRRNFFSCVALLTALLSPCLLHAQDAPAPVSGPRELLALYGFDDSYFSKLPDATPLDENQTEPLLRGMFALRKFTREEVTRWQLPGRDLPKLLADAPGHAGEIIVLRGRIKHVTRVRPDAVVARRFDLEQYFRCEVELTTPEVRATIFALAIPRGWLNDDENERELDQRFGCQAVFLKRQSADAADPSPVFLAQRMAWFPEEGNFATLGNLGFDAGLIDGVRDKVALAQSSDLEREAFYGLLDAVGRTSPGELHAVARTELRTARGLWETELEQLGNQEAPKETILHKAISPNTAESPSRPQEVAAATRIAELTRRLERAADEAEDVTPLFNAPDEVRGRLVTLLGTARRAIEIRVDDPDILARFGIDHYFEIELVTPDSRGNPIAICVRELPPGMPLGEEIYEPLRVTGFFLKTWGFRTAQSKQAAPGEIRKQLAPLLIGRDVEWLKPAPEPETSRTWIIASVVATIALFGGVVWWIRRDSRGPNRALPERVESPHVDAPRLAEDDPA